MKVTVSASMSGPPQPGLFSFHTLAAPQEREGGPRRVDQQAAAWTHQRSGETNTQTGEETELGTPSRRKRRSRVATEEPCEEIQVVAEHEATQNNEWRQKHEQTLPRTASEPKQEGHDHDRLQRFVGSGHCQPKACPKRSAGRVGNTEQRPQQEGKTQLRQPVSPKSLTRDRPRVASQAVDQGDRKTHLDRRDFPNGEEKHRSRHRRN